jgi:hypothetical protein
MGGSIPKLYKMLCKFEIAFNTNSTLTCPGSRLSTGHLEKAEAIYNGARGNLVGIRTRLGNTPQHGVLFGMTGAGKSVIVADLLAQTGHRFGFRLIVEEGQRSRRDRLDATEPVDGGGLHCVLFRLRHDFSPGDVLDSTVYDCFSKYYRTTRKIWRPRALIVAIGPLNMLKVVLTRSRIPLYANHQTGALWPANN